MSGRVVVVGSLNMDLVVRCARVPRAGETVAGTHFSTGPGGKGANQAAAAARHGGPVCMVGRVGRDDFGEQCLAQARRAGVDTRGVTRDSAPTGIATILVDDDGENRIVVVPGANQHVVAADAADALADCAGDVFVFQLEIPLPVVEQVSRLARAAGARVLLNAAPVQVLAPQAGEWVDHLVVNETEAQALTGLDPSGAGEEESLRRLLERGFGRVTITLGGQGALDGGGDCRWRARGPEVRVVDTTGAGDSFVGALAAAWAAGADQRSALTQAVAAGTVAVSHPGAQPTRNLAAEHERIARKVELVEV